MVQEVPFDTTKASLCPLRVLLELYRDALEISIHEIVIFELFDVIGKKQLTKQLNSTTQHQIILSGTQPGIYFYRLMKGNKAVESGKLIIE